MAVSREQLYEEVWAEPMTKVAGQYGVSSNFLARVCIRLRVPHPPRGYWQRLKVGKPDPRPPLPEAQPGEELEWSRDGEPRRVPRPRPTVGAEAAAAVQPRRRRRPGQHDLLDGLREHFDNAKEGSFTKYLRPAKRLLPDIVVSREGVSRALELANELFQTLAGSRHRVEIAPKDVTFRRPDINVRGTGEVRAFPWQTWHPARPTVTYIGTVAIGITLFELSEEIEGSYEGGEWKPLSAARRDALKRNPGNVWTSKQDVPSGRFAARVFSPYVRTEWEKEWREVKAGEFPRLFKDIVGEIEHAAPSVVKLYEEAERQAEQERRRHEEQMRRWEAEQREQERIAAIRRQDEMVKKSRSELLAIIEAWALANHVEAFFSDLQRAAQSLPEGERSALLPRLKLARQLLGGTDPLKRFSEWRSPSER